MITIKDEDGDELRLEAIPGTAYAEGEEGRLEIVSPIGAWLTRQQAADLIITLQRWIDTGKIE